jgi:hypothetical protein
MLSKISTRPDIAAAELLSNPSVVAQPPEIANCGKTIGADELGAAFDTVGIELNSWPENLKPTIEIGTEL